MNNSPRLALFQNPALHPGSEDVEFGLAHCAFQAEQQSVVEVSWIIRAILIEDEGIGRAQISSKRCQSIEFRANRDASNPSTIPPRPRLTSVTSR